MGVMCDERRLPGMANINPEEIRSLATQLMQDSETINSLAQTMLGKVQRMEEGAAGLHTATSTGVYLQRERAFLV